MRGLVKGWGGEKSRDFVEVELRLRRRKDLGLTTQDSRGHT